MKYNLQVVSRDSQQQLLRSCDTDARQEFKLQGDLVGGNMDKQEPGLNLAHTLYHVSHSLPRQTCCDLKPGSKSLQQGDQRGLRGKKRAGKDSKD